MLLLAALSIVFPVSLISAENARASAGTAYCSLSKKFQPIKAAPKKLEQEPFEYLCAGKGTKDFLFQEIILKNPFRVFSLDAAGLENLAFDVLAHGKTAIGKLPRLPRAPFQSLTGQIFSGVFNNHQSEYKLAWKNVVETFLSIRLKCAPSAESKFSATNPFHQATELARLRAPRAPPLFS